MASPELPDHVENTVRSVAELHERFERDATAHQRAIESLTRALGRPAVVYVVLACAGLWIASNVVLARTSHAFDPYPFGGLQTLVSLFALVMTILILTAERRIDRIEERRARLTLQINLLIEQETTKIIALIEQLRRDDPHVPDRQDVEAEALSEGTDVNAISHALERRRPSAASRNVPATE